MKKILSLLLFFICALAASAQSGRKLVQFKALWIEGNLVYDNQGRLTDITGDKKYHASYSDGLIISKDSSETGDAEYIQVTSEINNGRISKETIVTKYKGEDPYTEVKRYGYDDQNCLHYIYNGSSDTPSEILDWDESGNITNMRNGKTGEILHTYEYSQYENNAYVNMFTDPIIDSNNSVYAQLLNNMYGSRTKNLIKEIHYANDNPNFYDLDTYTYTLDDDGYVSSYLLTAIDSSKYDGSHTTNIDVSFKWQFEPDEIVFKASPKEIPLTINPYAYDELEEKFYDTNSFTLVGQNLK